MLQFFGVPEEERAPGPKLNSTEFPGLDRAAPASPEPARKHATWDTLLALQSSASIYPLMHPKLSALLQCKDYRWACKTPSCQRSLKWEVRLSALCGAGS